MEHSIPLDASKMQERIADLDRRLAFVEDKLGIFRREIPHDHEGRDTDDPAQSDN